MDRFVSTSYSVLSLVDIQSLKFAPSYLSGQLILEYHQTFWKPLYTIRYI